MTNANEKKLLIVFAAIATTQEERALLNCKPGTNLYSVLGCSSSTDISVDDSEKIKKEKIFKHYNITPNENLLKYSRIEVRLITREECTMELVEGIHAQLQDSLKEQLDKDGIDDLTHLYDDDPITNHTIAVMIAPEGFDSSNPSLPITFFAGTIGLHEEQINCEDERLKKELYEKHMEKPMPENFDMRNILVMSIKEEDLEEIEALKMALFLTMHAKQEGGGILCRNETFH